MKPTCPEGGGGGVLIASHRTAAYKRRLFWFCLFALLWTLFLLYAGGFTTSIEAGMAFLDWPLSNGSLNPEGWTKNPLMRAEHGHRLLGAQLGLLTIALFLWMHFREERRWVRALSGITLAMVVLQGLLGGLRVLLDRLNTGADSNLLAQSFAVMHACGAQIILCLMVALTVAASRKWIESFVGLTAPVNRTIRALGIASCALLFLQILIGAVMRHANAGLAIFTFPFSSPRGALFPEQWNWAVRINFLHRVGALAATLSLLGFISQIWISPVTRKPFALPSLLLLFLLALQIYLGALVTWTRINPYAATFHMLMGAFLLATCWMLTFLSYRLPFGGKKNRSDFKDTTDNSKKLTTIQS